MSEMMDALKKLAEEAQAAGEYDTDDGDDDGGEVEVIISDEPTPVLPPLEQALEKALSALTEITYYAHCGRLQGCLNEAVDAIKILEILKQQHLDSLPAETESDDV